MRICFNYKFKIIALIMAIIIPAVSNQVSAIDLAEFDLQVENEQAILYLNSQTTEIAVKLKDFDAVWFSNPQNREKDSIARGSVIDELSSQLLFDYYTPEDVRQTMNNYRNSNLLDQAEIEKITDGFRVKYLFGQRWASDDIVPVIISRERMESKILQHLASEDQDFILKQYQLIQITQIPEGYERVSVLNMDKDYLFGADYMLTLVGEVLEGSARRNLIQGAATHIVNNREDYSARQELKPENFVQLKDNPTYILKDRIRAWDWTRLVETITASGYTPYDTQFDHEANRIDPPLENIRVFKIVIEYRLDGRDLVVNVPVNELRFPQDVEDRSRDKRQVSFPLTTLSVLPYFGAAHDQAEGYIVIPDGSGALIYLNTDKRFTSSYEKIIYGRDFSVTPIASMPYPGQQIHLPIFGLKQDELAFLAIIEEGDAIGRIRADTAGRTDGYNKVYTNFNLRPFSQLQMYYDATTTYLNVYQHQIYQGNLRIRYKFLIGGEADYVGMAHRYQEYLVNNYGLTPLDSKQPFIVELAAAIDHSEPILGVPRQVIYPLTTFEQAAAVVHQLMAKEISGLQIRYSGWLKGGIEHFYPDKVSLEPILGTNHDWKQLMRHLEANNAAFYPDVSLLLVYKNRLFDSFIIRTDASRFISRQAAQIYPYSIATSQRQQGRSPYILSPRKLSDLIDKFAQDYLKYQVNNICLRDFGVLLNSDYRLSEHDLINRQQARYLLENGVKTLAEEYELKLMTDGANSYVLPYVSTAVNVPLTASSLHIIDQGIPFLPIVLSGYWHYTGEAINLAENMRQALLKTLETGAGQYYIGTFTPSSLLKRTDFDYLYAVHYGDWLDDAVDFYLETEELLEKIKGQRIVDHRRLAPEVFSTTYESGVTVIVNYNQHRVILDSCIIEGESFIKVEGDPDEK